MSSTLGAHVSVAGGLHLAFPRAGEIQADALQIFVKSPNRWAGPVLAENAVRYFRRARRDAGHPPVVAHAAYLINLAAPDPIVRTRSRAALKDELHRCGRLGIDALIVHPGAHLTSCEEEAFAVAAASVDEALEALDGLSTRLLLEVTAGQGTVIGHRLEHLDRIRQLARRGAEVGICLDTCHLLAAGYPVHTPAGMEAILAETIARFGAAALGAIHVNDSQHPCGSRRDRHAPIGDGEIPLIAFRALLRAAPPDVPLLLETPSDGGKGHARDLKRLRSLLD